MEALYEQLMATSYGWPSGVTTTVALVGTGVVGAPLCGALNIRSHQHDHHIEHDAPEAEFPEYFDYDKYYDTSNQCSIGGEASRARNGLDDSLPALSPRDASRPSSMDGDGSPQYTSSQQSVTPPSLSDLRQETYTSNHDINLRSYPVASPSIRLSPTSSLDQDAPSTSASSAGVTLSARALHARECNICHGLQSDVGQLIDHLASKHPGTTPDPLNPSRPYFCGRDGCPKIKSLRDFKRHLTRTAAHSQTMWRCRCGHRFHRKENFRNHFNQKACTAAEPYDYVCACGLFKVDSQQDNAIAIFEAHFSPCEKAQKGRPRKDSRQGTCLLKSPKRG
ncbi:hypothetical protein GGR58DRAFT_523060 [Xylaria digitata]|nr:hypothetical protein GGR58DRAFT_523060 [Xylaria digitata]